jgi:hypothetical protein
MNTIEADYLVVGAGAMGMAFTDTLITDTEASVVMVDRAHQPGGHWTTAYPFVRLHQPSAYYGVNSRPLGHNTIDRVGWNQGFGELATSGEVCAYFDAVMQQQLLPTGRVSYFPMSEYLGDGRFRTLGDAEYSVTVKQRIVDATYLHTIVPSMRPAPYSVAPGVDCISPNELPKSAARERYVIVGAGKTGMDACLWLLKNGISPQRLTWIRPRDAWLMNRGTVQPSPTFIDEFRARFAGTLWSIGKAASVEDLFDRLEAAGTLLRIDPSTRPTMYRCAIVSSAELDQLRRIEHVIRWAASSGSNRTRSCSMTARFPLRPGPSTSTAPRMDCKDVRSSRFSTPIGSHCRACAGVSRCSAPHSSPTSKPLTTATPRKTTSARRCHIPIPILTGCG